MDHQNALNNQALERYFLNEMEPEERDAFEEHYFACDLCAEDVRATSAFVDNAKTILGEKQVWPKPARARMGWFRPSFALGAVAALCLAVIGYQNLAEIPGLKAPRTIPPGVIVDGSVVRSAGPKLHAADAVHLQMPWEGASAGALFVELREGSRTVSSGSVEAPEPHKPLDLFFPVALKPGRYNIVERASDNGKPGRELMQGEFEVIP